MGYEAYKLKAKFQNATLERVAAALREAGGVVTETFGGSLTMELAGQNGIIELVLNESGHQNMRFSPGDMVLLTLRFAKPASVRLAYDVLRLLRQLSARFDKVYCRDTEAGRELALGDEGAFVKAVTYAKYEFGFFYPVREERIRCREVYSHCHAAYLAAVAVTEA